jgi:hypothetical protein
MERRQIFCGNWKMIKTGDEADSLIKGLLSGINAKPGREYVVFPPATVCPGSLLYVQVLLLKPARRICFMKSREPLPGRFLRLW